MTLSIKTIKTNLRKIIDEKSLSAAAKTKAKKAIDALSDSEILEMEQLESGKITQMSDERMKLDKIINQSQK